MYISNVYFIMYSIYSMIHNIHFKGLYSMQYSLYSAVEFVKFPLYCDDLLFYDKAQ